MSSMTFAEFLQQLFAEGRVAVPEPAELAKDELRAALQVLQTQDQHYRLEMPGDAPEFDREAAIWAAAQFYRGCQLAVFRDAGEEAIEKLAKTTLEKWEEPSVHYSVDLTFRFLPDLVRIVHAVAADDPLGKLLMTWCRRWPLSSVGVKGVGEVEIGPIVDSPSLMTIYVDRILAREDAERMVSEPVRRAVRQALGLYSALAPKMAAATLQDEAD
jgi:hypothetical protein